MQVGQKKNTTHLKMFLKICPLGVSDMINECLPENCNHVNSDMNPRWASLSAATFHSYSSLPLRNFFFPHIIMLSEVQLKTELH